MKAAITIIALIALVIVAIFSVKWAQDRSKSNKTSLFGSMNSEYRDDPLFKMTPAALEGLDAANKKKQVREAGNSEPSEALEENVASEESEPSE